MILRLTDFGFDLARMRASVAGATTYVRNRREFLRQWKGHDSASAFTVGKTYPCLVDRFDSGGTAKGHYFHQDLYVAQLIHEANPETHLDVGSRIDGFVAHVAAFCPVEVMDIRPTATSAANINFTRRDIMQVDSRWDDYTQSLSCLHTVEHFGLGRYGDKVDFGGYRKGWENLARMVSCGGTFYFSVPISSEQRVEFDAHRVFSIPFLIREMIEPRFEVRTFSYVDDQGELHTNLDAFSSAADRSFDLIYGCGIFELIKRN